MLLSVCTFLAAHLWVSASSHQSASRPTRFKRELIDDIDGSGFDAALSPYEISTKIPQNDSDSVLLQTAAEPIGEPLQMNITIVADEERQAILLQEEEQSTAEVHHIITPVPTTEFLVVNVSLPVLPNDLISRLMKVSSKVSYNEKLDIALRLTSFTHELMSSIDNNLATLALS